MRLTNLTYVSKSPRHVRLHGSTDNGEQCSVEVDPAFVSVVVARCACGWFAYFGSLLQSPPNCPKCNRDLPENFIG
jgi:hypothetical protein